MTVILNCKQNMFYFNHSKNCSVLSCWFIGSTLLKLKQPNIAVVCYALVLC